MSVPYTAPVPALRTGIDHQTAAQLQAAFDALAWRDSTGAVRQWQQHATGPLVLGTAAADVPGATVTFTVTRSNAGALAMTVFAFNPSGSTADAAGLLLVDGVSQARVAARNMAASQQQPATQFHRVPLAVGAHTLRLQALKTTATGTVTAIAAETYLGILLIDNN
jgi:hypothetical protein